MRPFLTNREEIVEVFTKLQHTRFPFDLTEFTFHEDDASVSYGDTVWFNDNNLTQLPFRFRHVSRGFSISRNNLTTLIGCPESVGRPGSEGWDFVCQQNNLTSLDGGPRVVRGNYFCHFNPLTSLNGFPERFIGSIFIPYSVSESEISLLNERIIFDGEVVGLIRMYNLKQ